MAKGKGRRKGSRNRGYFFKRGRGWVANIKGRQVPLEYDNGDRMRDQNTPQADVKAAYHRLMVAPIEPSDDGPDVSVLQVCLAYLAKVEDSGARSTFISRQNTLFDFCFGLPSRSSNEMARYHQNQRPAIIITMASGRCPFHSYARFT